jgi:hypothetical protein
MYDDLYGVDYSVEDSNYKFVAELSFTFLHWKLMELMVKDSSFKLSNIDNSQV